MNNFFIILAAGESKRFNSYIPKPYIVYKGKPIIQHSIDKAQKCKKIDKILNVTVEFIAEVITCIKDKDKKIISGDPKKIKKIYDTWVFSRDTTSANPNWQLVNILT